MDRSSQNWCASYRGESPYQGHCMGRGYGRHCGREGPVETIALGN